MMKECWINVYTSKYGNMWLGTPRATRYQAEVVANKYLLYRIHVILK